MAFGVDGLLPEMGAGGLGIASGLVMWAQALAMAAYLLRTRRFHDLHLFGHLEPPRAAPIRATT